MPSRLLKSPVIGYSTITMVLPAIIAFCLYSSTATAEHTDLSDQFSFHMDPAAKELLGEVVFAEVAEFFHTAERAVEKEDLDALMALYSDRYSDGAHDKESARQIWKRVFSTFDSMATHHDMRLIDVSGKKNVVIMRCSGLLLGVPDLQFFGDRSLENNAITIDSWNQQDHVLAKEGGKWLLLGTYGEEQKRFGFDKPMHPLF